MRLKSRSCIYSNNLMDDGLTIAAVADGELIPMSEIPDSGFSEGMLGICIGILPVNGNVYSPCKGVVSAVAKTKHAVTIKADNGFEYLVHIGIDTVKMDGEGFTPLVNVGQTVECSEKIAVADIALIKDRGFSPMIIVVRINQ